MDVPGVRELVVALVAPALQPGGGLAALIAPNLGHGLKSRAQRSAECLNAGVKLNAALYSSPSSTPSTSSAKDSKLHLLSALFEHLVADSLARRPNLTGITILAESMPASSVPSDLLPHLLADVDEIDAAAQRCNAIVSVLARRRADPAAQGNVEEYMVAPLIPYLGNEDSVPTMSRYLLPALFKIYRHAYEPLLTLLDTQAAKEDRYFGPWVAAASYGVGAGYISLDALPQTRLSEAVSHADCSIRIMAFELLALSRSVFEEKVLELVKHALVLNTVVPTAGGRTDMLSAIHGTLTNMKTMEEIAAREVVKGAKGKPGVAERGAATLVASKAFHEWWLDTYLSPSIRGCREMPPLRAIFALKLLKLYVEVYGPSVHSTVYTPERVADLVACQASEFVDMRMSARHL